MKLMLKTVLLATAASLLCAVPALADSLNLTLSTPTVSVAPGGMYDFVRTLSAPMTNMGAIYLNGESLTSDKGLTTDGSDFYNSPVSLNPGESYTGSLFTVMLSDPAMGSYLGSVAITGGAGELAGDRLASSGFQVNAATPVAATPEPGSWLLLSTGLAGVGVLRRRFSTR